MGDGERILIVDDDANIRRTLSDIIAHDGYTVVTAATGATALKRVAQAAPAVALIDLKLSKEIDGIELIVQMQDISPLTENLIITGYASQKAAIAAVNHGCFGFIEKPFAIELLLLSIRRAVEKYNTAVALHESESKFRQVYERMAVGVTRISFDSRIDHANWACCQMMGYRRHELNGKYLGEILHLETFEENIENWKRLCRGKIDNYRMEGEFIHMHGHKIHGILDANLIRNVKGEPEYLLCSIVDITERKRAEATLRESEAQYRRLVEGSPDIVWSFSDKRGTLYASARVVEILGYSPDYLYENPWLWNKSIHPDDQGHIAQAVTDFVDGKDLDVEYRIKGSSGDWRWFRDRSIGRRMEGNETIIEGITTEITERVRAEEAIRESEEKHRTLFETMVQGVVYQNADGYIFSANQAAERILGLTLDQMQGRTSMDPRWKAIHEDGSDFPGDTHPSMVALATGKEVRDVVMGVFNPELEDHTWININAVPQFRQGETAPYQAYTIFEDITERKQSEDEMRAALLKLKRSNRDLEQFAYVASHDLQEPLRMISSYVQLLARRYRGQLDDDADEFIDYVVGGAKRLQALILALLDYTCVRTRGQPLAPTDMNSVMEGVLTNFKLAIADSDAEVTCDVLPTVNADAAQMAQLLQNLIANALKFHGDDPPRIHVSAERHDTGWRFAVRDNGLGIDPKYHERIFIIFQRLHARDDFEGTGIGLSVVKNIVQRHGGRAWVESEPGAGATFYFTIPMAPDGSP